MYAIFLKSRRFKYDMDMLDMDIVGMVVMDCTWWTWVLWTRVNIFQSWTFFRQNLVVNQTYLHIKPVVDCEFLAFKHLKASGNWRYESIARVLCVRPLTVCNETVVQLVRQSGGIVLRGVELKKWNDWVRLKLFLTSGGRSMWSPVLLPLSAHSTKIA